jgi:putative transcriptional regulator
MIKNNLSKLMGEKRIRISELHKISGLSQSTIIRIYYDKTKNISYETIDKLCEALECNTQELLEYIPDKNS